VFEPGLGAQPGLASLSLSLSSCQCKCDPALASVTFQCGGGGPGSQWLRGQLSLSLRATVAAAAGGPTDSIRVAGARPGTIMIITVTGLQP
jgi:hypothetical protein